MPNVAHSLPQLDPRFGGEWTYRVEMASIDMPDPHSYSTSVHNIGPSCNLAPFGHNETDIGLQSDRNRPHIAEI